MVLPLRPLLLASIFGAADGIVLPYSLNVSTTSVFSDVGATIAVSTNASWFKSGAVCSFRSVDTAFNSPQLDKYMALKTINATVINATHLTCRSEPTDNAGIALLTVTVDGQNFSAASPPISMFPAVEVAIGRRPYFAETHGSLLIRSAPSLAGYALQVTGVLANTSSPVPLLSGTVPAGNTTSLDFSLSSLPPAVLEELIVDVKVVRRGSTVMGLQKRKIFHRAPPPEPSWSGSVWQVDHSRRALRVNDLPFIGVGWFHTAYSSGHSSVGDESMWDSKAHTLSRATGASVVAAWGKRGHTLVLLGQPGNDTIKQLDDLQRSGIHAMITLPYLNGVPANNIDLTTAAWSEEGGYMDQIYGNMSIVSNHPAVQGWYICDDCCKGYDYSRNLSQAYKLLRQFDPYHVTTGAAECNELQAFQEPFLSLDFPMVENYRPDIAFHAGAFANHLGTSIDGNSGDVALRLPPLTFEPIANMPGYQRTYSNVDQQTLLWTGLVTANMASQNWFIWNRGAQKRWQITDAIEQVHAQILELLPSFYADVRIAQPTVTLNVEVGPNVMANIWRESTADVCLHIVVVNVDVEFHPFQLNITGLTATELSVAETDGLFPLFDGSCSANPGPGYRPGPGQPGYTEFSSEYQCRRVNVSSFATASDFIAPSETNIYRLGCGGRALATGIGPAYNDSNLVQNGAMELVQQAGIDGCVMHRMGCNQNWLTYADTEDGGFTDDRAWISMTTVTAHSGRHAARLQLPTEEPVMVELPIDSWKSAALCKSAGLGPHAPCANLLNDTEYTLQLWARAAEMSAAANRADSRKLKVAVMLGAFLPTGDTSSGYSRSKFVGQTLKVLPLSAEWSLLRLVLPAAHRPGSPVIFLRFGGSIGSVFFDDVVLVANQSTTKPSGWYR